MTTSAQQTYIARLGFSDPDRSKDRHGLACEYLYERILATEIAESLKQRQLAILKNRAASAAEENQLARQRLESITDSDYPCFKRPRDDLADKINQSFNCYNEAQSAIAALDAGEAMGEARSRFKPSDCINAPIRDGRFVVGFADVLIWDDLRVFLGEVKITRQPAEQVLQQINFYRVKLSTPQVTTYVLADYDCSDLQRLTSGSSIKVFRLGQRFEDWLAKRAMPTTEEL